MTPQQWEEVKKHFHEALKLPADARQLYLAQTCSCEIVRLEAKRLLVEHSRARGFLSQAAMAPSSAFTGEPGGVREDFPETARFKYVDRLGAGTFGVVYQVFDRDRNSVIALKKLQRFSPDQLLRFKREFRSLVDLVHPNLVQLYELFGEYQQWFFTMELVQGVDFHSYARPGGVLASWPRLRDALYQLAAGVQALHSFGCLHRDLKPSNVLVTEAGRVVILDFGLVKEFESEFIEQSLALIGSPGYMAPEQAAGGSINEAADWYGVGVMLYSAVTNQLPFTGNWTEALQRKQREDAASCRDLNPDVPEDLEQVCRFLLQRQPELRWQGVSRLLAPGMHKASGANRTHDGFVGRRGEFDQLHRRFVALSSGHCQVVQIQGRSGIGKTSLVSHFLSSLKRDNPGAVVLRGRCRESELVPYKAIDPIADELVRHLQSLAEPAAAALLPRHPELLPLLFPVFGDLEMLRAFKTRRVFDADAQEVRRRAFLALAELLGRMADRNPVVIWVDDLQWGDLDSVAFITDLLLPANAPALMLILSFRSEETESSVALRALRSFQQRLIDVDSWSDIHIDGLSEDDGRELFELLQPAAKHLSEERSKSILRASGGSPLLLSELLRFASGETEGGNEGEFIPDVMITQMIQHRLGTLSATARELLEALAVAGEPLTRATLHRTVKETDEDPARAIGLLIREHLVRVTGGTDTTRLEPFHDQVLDASLSGLSPEKRRNWHSHLAEVFETEGEPDPQRLLLHYRGAGNLPATFNAALAAAKIAETALAFEQAAHFYAEALETGVAEESALASLHCKRAEALANAGRGYESGQCYLEAARWSAHNPMVEMRQLAAQQLMRSGHLDEGTQILGDLMRTVGIHLPTTPLASVLRMLALRAFIRLRGLHWREQAETEIPAGTLQRLDLLWIGAEALASGNQIFGTYLQARHMLESLRAGEPFRLARTLGFGAFYESAQGIGSYQRGHQLVELAAGLAERLNDQYLSAITELSRAGLDFNCGFIEQGLRHCHSAAAGLDKCNHRPRAWELGTINLLLSWFLGWGGRIGELSERVPVMLEEARSRNDVYVDVAVRCFTTAHLVDLAADNPNRAITETQNSIKQWRQTRYDIQHFGAMFACMESHLYAGRTGQARALILADSHAIRHSLLFRKSHALRVALFYARGRTALAEWLRHPDARELRSEVEQFAAKLARLRSPWGKAFGILLQAGVMAGSSRRADALLMLERGEEILRQQDLRLLAAAVLRRRGELEGDAGIPRIEAADAFMRSEKILRPDHMTAMILPGDWL